MSLDAATSSTEGTTEGERAARPVDPAGLGLPANLVELAAALEACITPCSLVSPVHGPRHWNAVPRAWSCSSRSRTIRNAGRTTMTVGSDFFAARGYVPPMPIPAQIRAARALVDMTQSALAERVGLTPNALVAIEKGRADPKTSTMTSIKRALEEAGVEFTNGDQPGVRFQRYPTVAAASP